MLINNKSKKNRILILTGMSGAGKSSVAKILEDLSYYCIDNIPLLFIPKIAQLCENYRSLKKTVIIVDSRTGDFFNGFEKILQEMTENELLFEVLYLQADINILIRRYKESRRKHPLALSGYIEDGIKTEKQKLEKIKKYSNFVIDTSNLSIIELKEKIMNCYGDGFDKGLTIKIVSFGFIYGILLDADMIFDVRFLANPYYKDNLRFKLGIDKSVADYLWKWPKTQRFIYKLYDLLDFLVPNYIQEGKAQLIIGIGCTGGTHRSVFISEKLYKFLNRRGYNVDVKHRDAEKNLQELRLRH